MASRASVSVLACALVAVALFAPATAKPAAACTLAPITLEHAAEVAEIVIVGEVIDEQVVAPRYPTYVSTVRVSAVLKGHPDNEVSLGQLGFLGAACDGGPRLAVGEQVLLFIGRGILGHQVRGNLQVVGYDQGKYLLADGEAKTANRPPIPAEDTLRRVADITGAPASELDAALAFARGELQPEPTLEIGALPEVAEEEGGPPALLIGLASAGAAIALLALLFAVRRLRRAR